VTRPENAPHSPALAGELRDTHRVNGEIETGIDPAAVRDELERVLGSGAFAGSVRLSRLLRFVVERTLDGRGDEIKEYVLGTEVFDRGVEYDPRLDSIVRVEARRLRAKLDEYYAGPGAGSTVAIRMRRGTYVPAFERSIGVSSAPPTLAPARTISRGRRPPAVWIAAAAALLIIAAIGILVVRGPARVEAGVLPRIAVLPFTHYPPGEASAALADRLADGIATELVRLGRFEVVPRLSARRFEGGGHSAVAIADALGAAWLVEARVLREQPDLVRLDVRLVDGPRDRKAWADEFSAHPDDLRTLERQAASAIAAAILR
jgi:TolB-like protein